MALGDVLRRSRIDMVGMAFGFMDAYYDGKTTKCSRRPIWVFKGNNFKYVSRSTTVLHIQLID